MFGKGKPKRSPITYRVVELPEGYIPQKRETCAGVDLGWEGITAEYVTWHSIPTQIQNCLQETKEDAEEVIERYQSILTILS